MTTERAYTASERTRVKTCPGAAVLSKTYWASKAAARGTSKHDDVEAAFGKGLDVSEEHGIDVAKMRAAIGGEPDLFEGLYSYNPDDDEAAYHGDHIRRVQVPETDVVARLDIVRVDKTEDVTIVLEFKGGLGWVDGVEENHQIEQQVLSATRHAGTTCGRGILAKAVDNVGEIFTAAREFGPVELAEIADAIANERDAVLAARKAWEDEDPAFDRAFIRPSVEACQWCPGLLECRVPRESMALVTDMDPDAQLTPEDAQRAWGAIQAVESMIRKVKPMLWAVGRQHPFQLSNGKIVSSGENTSEVIDSSALPILFKELGPETASALVEKIPKKAVEDACKLKAKAENDGKPGKGAAAWRDLQVRLREAKVLRKVTRTSVAPRKFKPGKEPAGYLPHVATVEGSALPVGDSTPR